MIYRNHSTHELRDLRKMADQELNERKEQSNKRVRDLLEEDTPTNSTDSSFEKSNQDRKESSSGTKTVEALKRKMAASSKAPASGSGSKQRLIPLRSLISSTKDEQQQLLFSLPPPKVSHNQSESEMSSSNLQKMIPVNFYSKKSSDPDLEILDDDTYTSSVGEKRARGADSVSEKPSKKMKEMSFEAALSNNRVAKKKKPLKPRKSKVERNVDSDVIVIADDHKPSDKPSLLVQDGDTPLGYREEPRSDCSNDKLLTHPTNPPTPIYSFAGLHSLKRTNVIEKNQKRIKRVFDKEPAKPRPLPSFSILPKKEIEFNGT